MNLQYETEEIGVDIRLRVEEIPYKDARHQEKSRLERQIETRVRFWDFYSKNNLHELLIIKGALSHFMHGYWKRSGKEPYRLNINQELWRTIPDGNGQLTGNQVLRFADRQKNKVNYLHISLHNNKALVEETYLDIQEVIILEGAIVRAMQLLSPTTDIEGWNFYDN
jgi:hypothetical protein